MSIGRRYSFLATIKSPAIGRLSRQTGRASAICTLVVGLLCIGLGEACKARPSVGLIYRCC